MKKINFRPLLYAALLVIITIACKVEELNKPSVTNTNPPGVVSNIAVVNLNGKAQLTYTIPGDADLSYVKAVYEIIPGVSRVVKASYYTNVLVIDGFGDTLAHNVKIYAVNTSEIASAPVIITVNPLTPAIKLALNSLKIKPAFGGFSVICDNPTKENLAIIPLVDTAGMGVYVQTVGMDNIYSNEVKISSVTRGQPAVPRKYAFVVRDRWLNQTDTLFQTLTPIFEQLIPKATWSNLVLPGDAVMAFPGSTDVKFIYNGNSHEWWPNLMFTLESAGSPQTVTLDLGAAHSFSRLSVDPYQELGGVSYVRGSPRDFEIWGSNAPNANGTYDASWTKLLSCTVIKPSGSVLGTETAADRDFAWAGWRFDFPEGLGNFRYIRIKNLRNWQGTYFMSMYEFTLWGQ